MGLKNKGDVVRWFSLIVHAFVGYAIYYRMFTEHWYYFSYTMQFTIKCNTIQYNTMQYNSYAYEFILVLTGKLHG